MKEANRNSKVPKFVRRVEMVKKKSIMYYQQQDSQSFLKIVVALPTMVASCRGETHLILHSHFIFFWSTCYLYEWLRIYKNYSWRLYPYFTIHSWLHNFDSNHRHVVVVINYNHSLWKSFCYRHSWQGYTNWWFRDEEFYDLWEQCIIYSSFHDWLQCCWRKLDRSSCWKI